VVSERDIHKLTYKLCASLLMLSSFCLSLTARAEESTYPSTQQPSTQQPSSDLFQEGEALLTPTERWAEQGLRLELSYLQGEHTGLKGSPNAKLNGVEIGLGARLEPRWRLMGRLQYALASEGVEGLHLHALIEPSYLLTSWLSVGVMLGVAGILELKPARPDAGATLNDTIVATYDHPDGAPPLAQCVGFGPAQGLRLNARWVLGPLSALTLAAFASSQRVSCVQESDRVEPDTAEPIERRQRWSHLSWGVLGGVSWR
jgi:hypothetical protein